MSSGVPERTVRPSVPSAPVAVMFEPNAEKRTFDRLRPFPKQGRSLSSRVKINRDGYTERRLAHNRDKAS